MTTLPVSLYPSVSVVTGKLRVRCSGRYAVDAETGSLTAVRIERQTAGWNKGDGGFRFVVSLISTYHELWVAQVWIFRPGKL
jgi:hypothetical protein